MLFDWSLEGFKLRSTCVRIYITPPLPLQKNLENSQMCFNLENSQKCFTNVNGDISVCIILHTVFSTHLVPLDLKLRSSALAS